MAKLSVTVISAVIFFLISLTLSQARIGLNLPGNDVINREVHNLPVSDVTPTIRLPSETSNEESPVDSTNRESSTVTVSTMPLNFVRFRPINRHFYTLRATFPYRRCNGQRHHHDQEFRPLEKRVEIPYGNDMILSTGENKDLDPMNFHGGARQIPSKWVKLQHLHHHHHHHHYDLDDVEEKSMKREKTKKKGGLFKRFRKFLKEFEF